MKKNNRQTRFLFLFIFIVLGIFIFHPFAHAASSSPYAYTPLENIPGFEGNGADLGKFILSLYQFGIWTVGIAAILMLTIGGFMYMTSAGNTSKMDVAKRVVVDAITGLIVALLAYLILFVINPDLVKISLSLKPLGTSTSTTAPGTATGGTTGGGTGQCGTLSTGPCSVDNLRSYFGDNAEKASGICLKESGGIEDRASTADICKPDGPVASWGLFQFNLTANNMGGLNCPKAFDKMYTGSNKTCKVVNQSLYNQCVAAAKNPDTNIKAAVSLSKGGTNWNKWGANKICGF